MRILLTRNPCFHIDLRNYSPLRNAWEWNRSLTLGLLPPIAPGRMEPVSWYRQRILDTQPCETRSCLEITQGRMPWWAISTILCRMWFGSGLPLMKTPPSWFTRPWPRGVETAGKHSGPKRAIERGKQPEDNESNTLQYPCKVVILIAFCWTSCNYALFLRNVKIRIMLSNIK